MSKEKSSKASNEALRNQLLVLRALSGRVARKLIERESIDSKVYRITEIAQMSGLNDEKETQRYLFILEGQKLVSPLPEGDLTSKTWHITPQGLRAVSQIEKGAVV
jgi:hypothetical protein